MSLIKAQHGLTLAVALTVLLVSPAAQAETTPRVPVVSRTIFYLPAWTAEKQGFFRQEGLDLTIEVYDTSENISTICAPAPIRSQSPRSRA